MHKFQLIITIILFSGLLHISAQSSPILKDSIPNPTDVLSGDAMKMNDMNRDSAINIEYRKRRDAMNNKGMKIDTGMHSTFRMNREGASPDSAMNHVPEVNGDLNMNRVPATNRDSIMNQVPSTYSTKVKRDKKMKRMQRDTMNDSGMNEDRDSKMGNQISKKDKAKNKMTKNLMPYDEKRKYDNSSNTRVSRDGLTMRNGKMMEMKNGALVPMNYNITLVDGTHVSQNGAITKKNGTKLMMKDGDFIDFYGKN